MQRTLTAIVSAPVAGCLPRAKGCTPQVGQNWWAMCSRLKRYSVSGASGVRSVKAAAGMKLSRKPLREQCEQLHDMTGAERSTSASNLTEPQWQLPTWVVMRGSLLQRSLRDPGRVGKGRRLREAIA